MSRLSRSANPRDQDLHHHRVLHSLSEFLSREQQLEAILVDADQRSLSLATLGEVDAAQLEEKVRQVLRLLEAQHPAHPAHPDTEAACTWPDGVLVKHLPGETLIEKSADPAAARFWQWHRLDWPAPAPSHQHDGEDWRAMAWQAALCGLALAAAVANEKFALLPPGVTRGLFGVSMLAGAWEAAGEAWAKLRHRRLDIHFLMLAVAVGAVAIGAWTEGALLLFLFSASGAIEHYALHRTHREIDALTKAAPKFARVLRPDGETEEREVSAIRAGDRLMVRPDEVFPVDAEITEGTTACDESTLTGEALPVEKNVGDHVSSGTLNLWGVVTVTTLRPAQDSALQKIIDLIHNAQHLRAPSQRFTDRFGSRYAAFVLGAVVVMFLVWWQGFGLPAFRNTEETTSAFYRAMTLLVVASPCALVLSIPSAILAAIAWGAKHGILFRGGAAIERLAEVDTVALDKTGTLTTGDLVVTTVESVPPGHEREILDLAFTLEQHSNHPLARAITAYGKREGAQAREMTDFRSLTGLGLRAEVDGKAAYLGRRELMSTGPLADLIATVPEPGLAHTEVWVAHDTRLGRLLLKDEIRPESRPVLEALAGHGLRTLMLTGDRRQVAEAAARALGVAEVRAGLHPEDKVEVIRTLSAAGHKVAMVGDGVNDAPSLAAAHVSVAMGGRGSDAALEQSDLILMRDRIERLLTAFRLSRSARATIRQNLAISLGTVILMVGASLFGLVPLSLGVLAHEGSTFLVCLNSLRLLFRRDH